MRVCDNCRTDEGDEGLTEVGLTFDRDGTPALRREYCKPCIDALEVQDWSLLAQRLYVPTKADAKPIRRPRKATLPKAPARPTPAAVPESPSVLDTLLDDDTEPSTSPAADSFASLARPVGDPDPSGDQTEDEFSGYEVR